MATTIATKYVYFFDEGDGSMTDLLGGKGAGLAEMTRAGLPVPQGFIITTQACLDFYRAGRTYPSGLDAQVEQSMRELEQRTGKRFGDVAELSYYGPILDQDADMMPRVQRGLRGNRNGKITLANYQEIRIRHMRHTLVHYMNQV